MDEEKISVGLEITTENAENNIDGLQKKLIDIVSGIGKIGDNIANKLNKSLNPSKINTSGFKDKYKKIIDQMSRVSLSLESPVTKDFPEEGYRVIADGEDVIVEEINKDTSEINKNMKEVNQEVEETTKSAGLLSTIFARIQRQISRQIFYSIASVLNPVKNLRKILEYLTDVVNPRLGATFKNIGNNLTEYFATSPLFENLIHGAFKLIYLLQQIYNVIGSIFKWRTLDLFKTSLKTGKQLQKMQQQMVAGFDEINDIGGGNQQDQLDATPLGLGEILSEDEKAKLDAFAEKFRVVGETIAKIIDWIKTKFNEFKEVMIETGVWDFIKEHWLGIAIAIGAVILVLKLLGGHISAVSGFVLVCVGLAAVLITFAEVLKQMNESGMNASDIFGVLISIFVTIGGLMALIVLLGPAMTAGLVPFLAVIGSIIAILLVMAITIPVILDACADFIERVGPILIDILNTIFDAIVKIVEVIGNSLNSIVDTVGKNIVNIINAISGLIITIGQTIVSTIDGIFNSIINFINKLGPAINNLVDNIIEALRKLFNFFTKGFETIVNNGVTAINWLFSPLRKVGNFVLDKVGLGDFQFNEIKKLSGLAYLDVGTNYVPNDQLAMIHQGEAVIPKKFNDREFFGGGNDETNALLEQLIDRFDNIDFQPYTTIKDVGRASVEYIKGTSRQLGRSVL